MRGDRRARGVGDRSQTDALIRVRGGRNGRCEQEVGRALAPMNDGETATGNAGIYAEDGALEHLFAAV